MLEQNGGKAAARDCNQNSGLHWKKILQKSLIQATDPKPPNKGSLENPGKEKPHAARDRNIRHSPLKCTTLWV